LLTSSSKPKTYLVPERERTDPPPRSPWGWLFTIFQFRDREVINKCGLDAYFFLRYLQTLLIIFIPLAVVILPILVPLNIIGGKGSEYALEFNNNTNGDSTHTNVTGLDELAFGNVRPDHTHRYWAHLILAILVIVWVCGVFFSELRVYIKVRQDYLTSAEHRLRASATTVLVSSIPQKWLTTEALAGLYDVFPGGIRNIWINRNFDELLDKIKQRDEIFKKLESAETNLIKDAKKAQKKQLEKDEKAKLKGASKEEKDQKMKREDREAEMRAQSGGVSSGDPHQVPHTVDGAIDEEEERQREQEPQESRRKGTFKIPVVGGGLAAVGKGLGGVGNTVFGGAKNVVGDINNQLETTNGFVNLESPITADDDAYDEYGRYRGNANAPYGAGNDEPKQDAEKPDRLDRTPSLSSSRDVRLHGQGMRLPGNKLPGNTVRRGAAEYGGDGANDLPKNVGWWKFWQGPAGGFLSPIPTGYEEGDEFPLTQVDRSTTKQSGKAEKRGIWAKVKSILPFLNKEEVEPIDYPLAYNTDYKEDGAPAVWQRFLKKKDRPTHRLPWFSWTPGWLPGLPLLHTKVDTIYWCRGELAHLNLEIEMDQKQPERFPLMNSAFIQFNHQVAAHMASQAVTHHVPEHMAPRTVEISPKDVIWDNMSIQWWEAWFRTAVVTGIVIGMVGLWAFPVAWTATLSNLNNLADKFKWLHWLDDIPKNITNGIAGVLPALVLTILLAMVPVILNLLAFLQGVQTGKEKQRAIQLYYFSFLFVQVFLVVSISGGAFSTLTASATNIGSIPETLAQQLPKAANYFFSYMILQALSTASGTLLQITTLVLWYLLPKLLDSTPRQKWVRNTSLPGVTWGTLFPVYTNFACIALIYSVIAPIIIIFAIITFTLLWIAHRYNMLYVTRFELDTGGLLYPRAINQTFTGLYFMEVCMIGLFFLVRDVDSNAACIPQAIIMIVALVLTVLYQVLLNYSFGPLFHHLPITFEDEAVLRDEAFERAQARRLGLEEDDDEASPAENNGAIEMARLNDGNTDNKLAKFNPVNIAQGAGSWALRSGQKFKAKTYDKVAPHPELARRKRHRDIEAQKKIADALYGGYNDEIEDLTPDERDVLVKHAFQHYALRARRPTVWIPRDDIGVSDDEVKRTREYAGPNIWISNVGAALNGKCKVVYGKNPPDFSEIDLIDL
jgi:calcium permeable stress-gated cation channel